jgi:hypothetical protein
LRIRPDGLDPANCFFSAQPVPGPQLQKQIVKPRIGLIGGGGGRNGQEKLG